MLIGSPKLAFNLLVLSPNPRNMYYSCCPLKKKRKEEEAGANREENNEWTCLCGYDGVCEDVINIV